MKKHVKSSYLLTLFNSTFILFIYAGIYNPGIYAQVDPSKDYKELFIAVQKSHIFSDQKKFNDCIPKYAPEIINQKYQQEKDSKNFDLRSFINEHFDTLLIDTTVILKHIEYLWPILIKHTPLYDTSSSLIPLPYPYIVPGGRFKEMYYWDSYFTMLGLKEAGRIDVIEHIIHNFCYLMDEYGHIPNGNRTYYLSRSQPPFFSSMVELLADVKGDSIYIKYLPWMEKEYRFWMDGEEELSAVNSSVLRVVKIEKDAVLNRYWDTLPAPRPESYSMDLEVCNRSQRGYAIYYDIRTAAESGWDFSSRWLHDSISLESIITTRIIPVDLNCLLYHMETTLARAYKLQSQMDKSLYYKTRSEKRKNLIMKYHWDEERGYFFDYDYSTSHRMGQLSLAGLYPLFFKLVDSIQAGKTVQVIKKEFLKPGGLVTTPIHTGQQWDYPNGWAPLQWIGYTSLKNYGYNELAREIAVRWIDLNCKVFFETGKMMEKYDVVDIQKYGGGGEYKLQDGFGWTNGVFLKMWNEAHE